MLFRFARVLCTMLLLLAMTAAFAADPGKPFLAPLFTSNMVWQRDVMAPIWGWTTPGVTITVRMLNKTATATADVDGKWLAKLGPFKAGGPYTLTVSGPETVTLQNVLVGDVWLCSGQSNMEMGILLANNGAEEAAKATDGNIRLFFVPKVLQLTPQQTVSGQWDVCSPATVAKGGWGGFSAAAYFFGRQLRQDINVPIGLIDSSWGGTPAEAWTSGEKLQQELPEFLPRLQAVDTAAIEFAGKPVPAQFGTGTPGVLYNGMIAPLLPFAIKGAIWYQGESNAGAWMQYRILLPAMISDWRARFGVGDFPFLIVSIANYMAKDAQPADPDWARLREAQFLTTQKLPKCGLAITIDIGDTSDIHPKNKQEVGRRLALPAEALAYGKKLEYSGPVYSKMTVSGNTIRLSFDHLGGGLVMKGEKLLGFAIAGADHKYVWATAVIDGNTVVVSASGIANPVDVRYDWGNNPDGNLYNKAGLPTVPFRTDML